MSRYAITFLLFFFKPKKTKKHGPLPAHGCETSIKTSSGDLDKQ